MINYKNQFKNNVIYCNCDDYQYSNFVKYFVDHFQELGIKKIISTCYKQNKQGLYFQYSGTTQEVRKLIGNGDFRSAECIELLKEADIVITNPPFSLFRDYVETVMELNKKFLIIGNCNAIKYKEIFPYIKENKMWLGVSSFNSGMYFQVPNDYEYSETYKFDKERNGKKVMRVSSIAWFTNMEHDRRNQPMDLYMKYSNEYYPKYDNFNAIEVSKTCDIPMDFDGVMCVPITFLDKYNPNQFEILDLVNRYMIFDYFNVNETVRKSKSHCCNVNGEAKYSRILIKRK